MAAAFDFQKCEEIIIPVFMSILKDCRYNSRRTDVISVCPYCNGGRSRERTFYLSIPTENRPRFIYNCYRASCRQSGIVNPEFMRMIGCNIYEVNVELQKVNNIRSKYKGYKDKSYRDVVNFNSPRNELSDLKLKYLNDRLGLSLTLLDLRKLKINTDMKSLYYYNDIPFPRHEERRYTQISTHGIAFITTYNDFVVVRRVVDHKYVKPYSIISLEEDPDSEDKFKSYSIPTQVDLMHNGPVEIIMCEGPFDILSIYYNIENGPENPNNRIFVSVSGASYEKVLTHFIRKYGLLDIVVKIYSDNDVSIDVYQSLYNKIKKYILQCEWFVFYNKKKKDFGYPPKDIEIDEVYLS